MGYSLPNRFRRLNLYRIAEPIMSEVRLNITRLQNQGVAGHQDEPQEITVSDLFFEKRE